MRYGDSSTPLDSQMYLFLLGAERAGLVPWVGGLPDASFGFYLREAFQSHTNTEKILYNESR